MNRRRTLLARLAVPTAAVVLSVAMNPPPAIAGTGSTWQGGTGTPGSGALWSHAANWVGGAVPSGDAGQLTFPLLDRSSCTFPTCYYGHNDIAGLAVDGLSLADSYEILGDAIKLGAGGITDQAPGSPLVAVDLPLTLTASQTWTVAQGKNDDFSSGPVTADTSLETPPSLTVDLAAGNVVAMSEGVEVGPLTFSGAGDVPLTADPDLRTNNGAGLPGSLNAKTGQPTTLTGGVTLLTSGATQTGPLDVQGAAVSTTDGEGNESTLATGSVTFDSASTYATNIVAAGAYAGLDYGQLKATTRHGVPGNVSLGGAKLDLTGEGVADDAYTDDDPTFPACATMRVGQADPLITATGTITGTFQGISNGAVISTPCTGPGKAATVRITYTTHAVTATAVTSGSTADRLHLTISGPTHAKLGHAVRIRTRVMDRSTHKPVAHQHMWLQARRRGSQGWSLVTQVTTGHLGRTSYVVHPRVTTTYRWQSQSPLSFSAMSATHHVTVSR